MTTLIHRFLAFLRWVFRRPQVEENLHLDVREYIEMFVADRVSEGMNRDEALRLARMEIGGVEQTKERVRAIAPGTFFETFFKDIAYALRTLTRSKGWTAVAVISLALGIGANTAIFSEFQSVLLDRLDVADPDTLVALRWGGPNSLSRFMTAYGYSSPDPVLGPTQVPMTMPLYRAFRDTSRTLESVFAFAPAGGLEIRVSGEEESVPAQYVSGTYYSGLGLQPVLGRLIGPDDDTEVAPPVAVISETYWLNRFGADGDVIGGVIDINAVQFVIVGVAPAETGNLHRAGNPTPAISIPLETEPRLRPSQSLVQAELAWWLQIMGRLRADRTIPAVQAELAPVMDGVLRNQTEDPFARIPELVVVPGLHGTHDPTTGETTALTIMGGVFAIILVIVCINVANLTLSRDDTRSREIAIRSAIGASRLRLARQFLVEGMVLTAIGAIAALGLAHLGLTLTPVDGVESHVFDVNVLAFVFGLTIAVGMLLGIVSATGAARSTRLLDLSRGQDAANPSRGVAGRALVVVQVALSLVLVIGAGLFLGTLASLRSTPSGFNPDNLVVLFLGMGERGLDEASRSAFYEGLSSMPGVESFTPTSDALFGSGQVRYSYPLDGDDPESLVSIPTFWVGSGFLDVNQIALLSGRGFEPQDERTGRPVAVVTETFVREFFDGREADALGQRLPVFETDVEIVGISADVKYGNLREAAKPMVYIVDPGQAFRLSRILVRTSIPPDQVMPAILETAGSFNPEGRFSIASQQEEIARTYRNERLYAVAASLFGALALSVSMVGLFGLLSYAVSRRTKEIGIRMAVGARKPTILGSVLGESLKLVSAGIVLGLCGAFVLTRYVQSLLYGLEPNDPRTLLTAVAVMIAVSIGAAFVPAHRAASVNPMVALRHD